MAIVSQSSNRACIQPPGADIAAELGCQAEIDADETEASFVCIDPDCQQLSQIDLSSAQRAQFRTAFRRDQSTFAAWSRNMDWPRAVAPKLNVIVANNFKTSRAL